MLNSSNYNDNNIYSDFALTPNAIANGNAIITKTHLSSSRSVASTSATKSKIPTSSRNSSRESSPGRRSSRHIYLKA
jgi:hypothetical protein